tara:strand:- start:117 stop:554 length:438 start_codon:yes stop_codon:yes gene_type:complete
MTEQIQNMNNYDKEYNDLMLKIQHIKVSSQNLMLVLEYVIEIVEKIKNLKGNKKKGLAILLIKKVVENSEMDEEDRKLCMAMINNGIVGDTIDLVINAVNGKLDFDDVIETGNKCCLFLVFKFLQNNTRNKRKRQRIKSDKNTKV